MFSENCPLCQTPLVKYRSDSGYMEGYPPITSWRCKTLPQVAHYEISFVKINNEFEFQSEFVKIGSFFFIRNRHTIASVLRWMFGNSNRPYVQFPLNVEIYDFTESKIKQILMLT